MWQMTILCESAGSSEMRASIDNIDATLIYVLAERFRLTKRVGMGLGRKFWARPAP